MGGVNLPAKAKFPSPISGCFYNTDSKKESKLRQKYLRYFCLRSKWLHVKKKKSTFGVI